MSLSIFGVVGFEWTPLALLTASVFTSIDFQWEGDTLTQPARQLLQWQDSRAKFKVSIYSVYEALHLRVVCKFCKANILNINSKTNVNHHVWCTLFTNNNYWSLLLTALLTYELILHWYQILSNLMYLIDLISYSISKPFISWFTNLVRNVFHTLHTMLYFTNKSQNLISLLFI